MLDSAREIRAGPMDLRALGDLPCRVGAASLELKLVYLDEVNSRLQGRLGLVNLVFFKYEYIEGRMPET